ncbi:hemerythrin domain-containing protein [Thauera aromatica]|uniref:Hemerythrin HHE cation binding domain protein n=2 Tax=Thauera aromatica TaxID=59405 RepID=A0A2R4BL80_THAAR|nr:hemerythrin domain-containing protein [Thauera aromatica]AVR88067.1 Hemerythrin HHE cation binding domain protein [Thauera aromatica K172]MCK2096831.1 hemerythrin domain-containing protein [Thauera aromatica]
MKAEVIQIIKDEHLAISAVLYTLRYLVREMRAGTPPDFTLLKAILDYIVSYPDRWHHPKEDEFLFAAIKRRTHEADALVARLEREHQLGYPMIELLKEKLIAFRNGDKGADQAFFELAERYVGFEWAHLHAEEDLLLPLAERVLVAEDWATIGAAFRAHDNPLFGIKPGEEARTLYQTILRLAPAPIGFGPGTPSSSPTGRP